MRKYKIGSNKQKSEQLGMPFGTACGRLRKALLYKYVMKAGENKCFQCGLTISFEEFSIEHKTPWQSKNPSLFWDLENVTFSHHKCNMETSRKTPRKGHGTFHSYSTYGCRCKECCAANTIGCRRKRTARKARASVA